MATRSRTRSRTRREVLIEYTAHARDIELAQVAISAIEGMRGSASRHRIIAALQREQQRSLPKMDAAAAALGAPYGGSTR